MNNERSRGAVLGMHIHMLGGSVVGHGERARGSGVGRYLKGRVDVMIMIKLKLNDHRSR